MKKNPFPSENFIVFESSSLRDTKCRSNLFSKKARLLRRYTPRNDAKFFIRSFLIIFYIIFFSSLAIAEDSPRNDLNALIQTNEQYRSFYILLAVVMVVAFVLLIFFNNREMRKKDRKIYDSAALLKHTIQAQEEERSRLSRELHDGIAQDMRYIVLLAERLKNETETERAASIAKIQKKQTDCIKEIRSLCYNLAPPAIQSGDLNAEFSTLCTAMQEKSDAEIRLIVTEDADFSSYTSEQRLNLYRIVQELLNNAVRHARAEEITVLVKRGKIIVTDDGSGIGKEILHSLQEGNTPAAGNAHFGLRNILERTRLLGGTAHFKSSRETGTCGYYHLKSRYLTDKKNQFVRYRQII